MIDDLISRQAAIEALGEEPEVWSENDEYALGLNNQWNDDVYALKGLPSAQRWIPVSERLPEYKQKVLCCVNGRIYIDERGLRGWRFRVTDYDAWLPLPEPWKGAEDD